MGESIRRNAHENSLHVLGGEDTSSHQGNASFLPALCTKWCQRSDFNSNAKLQTQETQKRCTSSLGNG